MDGPVDPSPVPSVESRERLLTLVRGCRISQAIYVATRLGIPDLLADGPREVDELAHATGSHRPSLHRVLLFLAGVGVLDKVGPRRFALTELAALLRTGVPGSLRPAVLLLLDESHWRPWGHLLHTVQTGEPAFHHAHGAGLFDYLAGHPEVASVFNAAMSGNSPAHAASPSRGMSSDRRASSLVALFPVISSHGNWVGIDLGISWENGNQAGVSPGPHWVEIAALQRDRT